MGNPLPVPVPALADCIVARFVKPSLSKRYLASSLAIDEDSRFYSRLSRRTAKLSSLILEAQLTSVPPSRTLRPKAHDQVFLENKLIPPVNALTLLAWQSICEIGSGFIWQYPNWSGNDMAMMPWPYMIPLRDEPNRFADDRVIYWTCICPPCFPAPRMSQGESLSSFYGANTTVVHEAEGGFGIGRVMLMLLMLNVSSNEYYWHSATFTEESPFDMMASDALIALIIQHRNSGFWNENPIAIADALHRYWLNSGLTSWKAVPLYGRESDHKVSMMRAPTEPWGIPVGESIHYQSRRLLTEHGMAMRFTDTFTINAWVTNWQHVVENQIDFYLKWMSEGSTELNSLTPLFMARRDFLQPLESYGHDTERALTHWAAEHEKKDVKTLLRMDSDSLSRILGI